MTVRTMRGGRGLGDSIYLRPIADMFLKRDERVMVYSDYPDVFLGSKAEVVPFKRIACTTIGHYVSRRQVRGTNQWEDVCLNANIPAMPLRFPWAIKNYSLVDQIRAKARGRFIVMVHGGRIPMDRTDGFGMEMLPEQHAFDTALAQLRDCLLVQIGKMDQMYPLNCELSLLGKTTVADLFDIATISHGAVAQCSFMLPLTQALGKPLLAIWAQKGLVSRETFISAATPEKVLFTDDRYVLDSNSPIQIATVAESWKHVYLKQETACAS